MQHSKQLKTALVTGGARRLGRAIVEDLANCGFNVAIHANSSVEEAKELAERLSQTGIVAQAFTADLTDETETRLLFDNAISAIGPFDLLINSASIFADDTSEHFDSAKFDAHFDIHLKAPLILSECFARQLPKNTHGLIVNMIDQRVWALRPNFFSYTLSKSALWTATQTMAQAFAPAIRVNAIGPGPTLKNDRQSRHDFQKQIDGLILKRGPEIDEFGRTIRYLYDTPSVTGQMIALDGGQHLAWETPDVTGIKE